MGEKGLEKHGFLYFLQRLFSHNPKGQSASDKALEPEYWPEVIEFREKLNDLIKKHTVDDPNVNQINYRIIDYVFHQIYLKASLSNIEERYTQLDTLTDRILSHSLSKLVGVKPFEGRTAEFSQAVEEFKRRLQERHRKEISNQRSQKPN